MDFKESEWLIGLFQKRPWRTICIIFVCLVFISVIAFLSSFFGEKGKRIAGSSKEAPSLEKPIRDISYEHEPPSAIKKARDIQSNKEKVTPSKQSISQGQKVSKRQPQKRIETSPQITINQHTSGDSSHIINAPGGEINMNYGAPNERGTQE